MSRSASDTGAHAEVGSGLLDSLTILVPSGAEYRAVNQGLRDTGLAAKVIAVPAGVAISDFAADLEREQRLQKNVLLLGLGGGLCDRASVGRSHLLTQVWNAADSAALRCDDRLTAALSARLGVELCVGITCEQVVTAADEKRVLGNRYRASGAAAGSVDMESFWLLQALPYHAVAILRVVSDSCQFDLPNISQAVRPDGSLDTIALSVRFIQRPIAALRFIYGSLMGLKQLAHTAKQLAEDDPDRR